MRNKIKFLLISLLSACAFLSCSFTAIKDGRARPSNSGTLQVVKGKLCDQDGQPVMLRGISTQSILISEPLLNEQLFKEMSHDDGMNIIRLAMYTSGVGITGYCTKGDKERHKKDIFDAVENAKKNDMYAIIDWHILGDGDPNIFIEESKIFFDEMSKKFCSYNNVLYEICNEPNGVEWPAVKSYAEQIIPIIRKNDPDSVIIVGNPDWSKDLESVAEDQLDFENILYTLHFYSASHKEEFREMTKKVSQAGLPIFVTEYSITASSGGLPRDIESADEWIALLEEENISYCLWALAKVPEACSIIRHDVHKNYGFVEDDYTPTGKWLMETLKSHNSR